MMNKYPFLNINEEEILKGLKQIQNICKIINKYSYLSCNDCPFNCYCETGLLSFIQVDDEEKESLAKALSNINEKIKKDKMTF